jgi:hypothetical protein
MYQLFTLAGEPRTFRSDDKSYDTPEQAVQAGYEALAVLRRNRSNDDARLSQRQGSPCRYRGSPAAPSFSKNDPDVIHPPNRTSHGLTGVIEAVRATAWSV